MAIALNGARGEVLLKIDNVELVIAATMEGLANVSSAVGCKSMGDLFARLSGVEAAVTLAAIQFLTVRGDKAAALEKLQIRHFEVCAEAFALALSHHFEGDAGNVAAKEKKSD